MKSAYIYFMMFLMLLAGTMSTLLSKALNSERSEGHTFHHPYFQTATVFLGEFFCLPILIVYMHFDPSVKPDFTQLSIKSNSEKFIRKMKHFSYTVPTLFDLFGTTLSFMALIFIAPSVFQMIKGLIVVIVAIYSIIFLKKKIYRHQFFGCALITLGVVAIGIVSIVYQAASSSNPLLGIVLMFIGTLFTAGMFTVEELYFSKVLIDPLFTVGSEGLFGVCYFLVLLPIFYFIPCELEFCINGKVEDTVLAFRQIGSNGMICFLWFASMAVAALVNWSGASTTKHVSSLARSTIFTLKILFVWICSIFLGWEVFLWPQLIGFFLIASGTMIYNEVLVLPVLGMKESVGEKTRDQEAQKSRIERLESKPESNPNEIIQSSIN